MWRRGEGKRKVDGQCKYGLGGRRDCRGGDAHPVCVEAKHRSHIEVETVV